MSTWSTPITWSNGAVTAASMNTLRDNLLHLKGAVDLLTASTTADTGTTMYLDIRRANATDPALRTGVSGAANPEFQIARDGDLSWGAGGGSAVDITLQRAASTTLRLTGSSDPKLEVQISGAPIATTSFVAATVTGDATHRAAMRITPSGGGSYSVGNGTTIHGILESYETGSLVGLNAVTRPLHLGGGSSIQFGVSDYTIKMQLDWAANTRLYFNGDSGAGFERTGTGRVNALGRLGATDSIALKVQSGAYSDGSFSAAAESGLMGLDTGGFLYVREGSTWRFIETRGMMMLVGPFTWTNLAASQTDLAGDIGGLGGGTGARYVCPYAGDIVGFSVRGSTTCSAGTATFRGIIIAANTSGSVVINSTTDTQSVYGVQVTGTDPVAAGDRLGMGVTTNAGFTPTGSTEYAGWLHLLVRRR